MARLKDHEKALALRKKEMSYSQIKDVLRVSKSTLSVWLRDHPLSKKRIRELRDRNERRIERFRDTMRKKKEKRLDKTYKLQKNLILPLSKREAFIAGLFLYWADGSKYRADHLSLSNTDPSMIQFFIYWLNKCLKVPKKKMRVVMHLYSDMHIDREMKYWSKTIKIPLEQFSRPYIKKTLSERINHKGSFGHGTCNLRVNSVLLAEKIIMGLKAIADEYK
ncbi:MAG: hypothetical protein KJI70_02015 [Patescibacteria group bacterium]|nr:hypothetical protein [Patescibacteria group bacterium]